ncbi:MAG: GMC family oxidoreductase N-terminal domain-containing protein, partial [Salinisphaeraceae bacterium]|nr:GMC family oxidoreductase N-terminal domain-containing protein [Salinisphaeraceae bacterium]
QLNQLFIQACEAHGIPRNPDFNGAEQYGCGEYQVTHINGERCSAAKAFLTPNLDRPNLEVMTHAHVEKVLLEGKRATGVRIKQGGETREIKASREVILSGGAFNSPQILMLSGIGPGAHLQQKGIDTVHDLPGVGENLQDHIDVVHSYKMASSSDTFGVSLPFVARFAKAIVEWRNRRSGLVTSPYAEAGAFFCSEPDVELPDLQMITVRALVDDHGRKMHMGHGFSCHTTLLRPKARGTVRLANADSLADPEIDPQFLNNDEDIEIFKKGARKQIEVLESEAFDAWRGKMLYPVDPNDDAALEEDIRNRADTQYHPVGSCKMGKDDMAVVDASLRVHGMEGLRVVDGSIMPTLCGGNTNAPIIMIAEKAADMIKAG